MEVCGYCGERRGEKIGCCGENHWEEMPECPKCGAENVGRDGDTYECGDCENKWPHEENETLESRPLGWGLMLDSEQVA